MTRQVDVKALISHIVRGDGADRCRICMGDTTEGQVYLGDTVMMDGDRPVTLSELLEVITGVEVQPDEELPGRLCSFCTESALSAATFRNFCLQSSEHWQSAVQHLEHLHTFNDINERKSLYAVISIQGNQINLAGIGIEGDQCDDKYPTDQSDDEMVLDVKINDKPTSKLIGRPKIIANETFECPDCKKTFVNPQRLYDHLKDSTENKRACYICAAIMSQDYLVKHLKNVHNSVLYSCKKCPALSRSSQQLLRHIKKAHSAGAYVCGDCDSSFKSEQALRGHANFHLNKNCPSCDKLFRNRKCYTIHVKECCNLDLAREDTHRTKHKIMFEVENIKNNEKLKVGIRGSADNRCICDYCGKEYAGKKFVSTHIQIVHMKNTHRPCPYCGKSYAAAHMTEHIKKHEKVNPFTITCEQCGIVLKTKLGYVQHFRLHTGEKPYKCKYCSETFSASSRRSEHIRKSHKAPDEIILKHSCNLCPAKFRLPYKLRQHMDTVHAKSKDNIKEFECSDCHIKFSSYRGLLYHSRKHHTFNLSKKSTKKDKSKTK